MLLRYYRLFARIYSAALNQADCIVVNSTWTKNHVDSLLASAPLLRTKSRIASIVYPPCDMGQLEAFSLEARERIILSIAQFRLVIHVTKYKPLHYIKEP